MDSLTKSLASNQSKWITGAMVSVDGGLTTNSCRLKDTLIKFTVNDDH